MELNSYHHLAMASSISQSANCELSIRITFDLLILIFRCHSLLHTLDR